MADGYCPDGNGGDAVLPAQSGWTALRRGTGRVGRVRWTNPEAGDVIPESGYFHSEAFPLFLLTVYAKNQKANLTRQSGKS
jgi:hypothetical protein